MAYNYNPNPPNQPDRSKENPEWVKQAIKNRKDSSAVCYSCGKFKTIGGDIQIDDDKFPLCPICARISNDIKIRVCNVCEREFASINGLRTCFKCKGNHKKARKTDQLKPIIKGMENGNINNDNCSANH